MAFVRQESEKSLDKILVPHKECPGQTGQGLSNDVASSSEDPNMGSVALASWDMRADEPSGVQP